MKRVFVLLFIVSFLICGCGKQEEDYEKILKGYAKTYYEKHMMGVDNQDQAEVTLAMLKKANDYGDDYDLSELKKCSDVTTVILNLNNNKKIKSYEYKLKCK